MNPSIAVAVAEASNLLPGLGLGQLETGVIKFVAAHEIDRGSIAQRAIRQNRHVSADKADMRIGIFCFDGFGALDVVAEARRSVCCPAPAPRAVQARLGTNKR